MKIKTIPFNAVQKAFYKLLSEGQTAPVYDRIPAGDEEMPYIWLGEWKIIKHIQYIELASK